MTGSVRELCTAAAAVCARKGYRPLVLTDRLDCEARDAGRFLAAMARSREHDPEPAALLAGGETVVHVAGTGLGGRCQELVLGAAEGIRGMARCVISAFGSDGTDGPTDAAGGWVDGTTAERLEARGISVHEALRNNDAYHALDAVGGLWFTGPTGTNVNDLAVVLLGGDRQR